MLWNIIDNNNGHCQNQQQFQMQVGDIIGLFENPKINAKVRHWREVGEEFLTRFLKDNGKVLVLVLVLAILYSLHYIIKKFNSPLNKSSRKLSLFWLSFSFLTILARNSLAIYILGIKQSYYYILTLIDVLIFLIMWNSEKQFKAILGSSLVWLISYFSANYLRWLLVAIHFCFCLKINGDFEERRRKSEEEEIQTIMRKHRKQKHQLWVSEEQKQYQNLVLLFLFSLSLVSLYLAHTCSSQHIILWLIMFLVCNLAYFYLTYTVGYYSYMRQAKFSNYIRSGYETIILCQSFMVLLILLPQSYKITMVVTFCPLLLYFMNNFIMQHEPSRLMRQKIKVFFKYLFSPTLIIVLLDYSFAATFPVTLISLSCLVATLSSEIPFLPHYNWFMKAVISFVALFIIYYTSVQA